MVANTICPLAQIGLYSVVANTVCPIRLGSKEKLLYYKKNKKYAKFNMNDQMGVKPKTDYISGLLKFHSLSSAYK